MNLGGAPEPYKSVLDVGKQALDTIVNAKNCFTRDIIEISSGEESSDEGYEGSDDEASVRQPRANTAKVCIINSNSI